MKLVAVSQRVSVDAAHGERRDCLDQRWSSFLVECGVMPLLIPNHPDAAMTLVRSLPIVGVLLTGGNTLVAHGGDAPERDRTEELLLHFALQSSLPVVGVCRGMQVIQHHFGVTLSPVAGHVARDHSVTTGFARTVVNSFHEYGATVSVPGLAVTARADDGVVEAVRHASHCVVGMMWHPERSDPFRPDDLAVFQQTLNQP